MLLGAVIFMPDVVLKLQLKDLVPGDVFELFQMKLRDWNLMMDPLFRWCAHVCAAYCWH